MSAFAKRHYQSIAYTLQSCAQYADSYEGREGYDLIVHKFANMLETDNPLFKRDLFIQACQPGQNVRARKVA